MAPFRTTKRRLAVTAAAAVAAIGVFVGLGPTPGGASSHREAPLIAADPQADNTDLYAFVSPDTPNKVTIISNFIPFEEPAGGPNFYQFGTDVRYDVRIDNNGDARPDVVYRWTFHNHIRNPDTFLYNTGPVTSLDDPDLNMYQTYDVQRISGGSAKTHRAQRGRPSPAASAPRRCRTTTSLRDDGIVLDRQEQVLRRTSRRPVLRRSAGVQPALRRRPVRDGERHPGGVQRERVGLAGAQGSAGQGRQRRGQPDRRNLEHRLSARAGRQLGPGLTARQPVGERGRHPGREEGPVERIEADGRRAVPAVRAGSRGRPSDRRGLRDPGSGHPAQRPGRACSSPASTG